MTYQLWLVRRLHCLVQQVIPADVPEEWMFLQSDKRTNQYMFYGHHFQLNEH